MSKRIINRHTSTLFFTICFAAFSLATAAARPNDAWKDKDPQDWDEKDVQKILTDSPWSKPSQFGMAADSSIASSTTVVGSSAHPETGTQDAVRTGNPAAPGPGNSGPGMGPVTKFTVS
jgi:hypothetical protein